MAKQKTKQPVGYRLFPDNPRVISEDEFLRLQESLGDFGSLDGIVVNTSPGKYFNAIISGNQKAAIIGLENLVPKVSEQFETPTKSGTVCYGFVEYMGEHFPYREVYWSEEKCEVGNIRANNYGGHNDPEMLAAFSDAVLKSAGIDLQYENRAFDLLKNFGIVEQEIDGGIPGDQEGKYDEVEMNIETDIKTGDLFQIGPHRLLCGDCNKVEDVENLMSGEIADLVVTDPPYGVSYVGKTKKALTIKNDSMTDLHTFELWGGALSALWGFLKDGGAIYATVPAGRLQLGFMNVLDNLGALRQVMVWNKNSMVLGHSDYHYKHEPILYGWKPGSSHYFTDDRTKTTVLDFDRPNASEEHPTMKPVALFSELIENSSKTGWAVLDVFAGSGTTMVACEQLGRKCYAMEIDPDYCQVVVNRMAKLFPELEIFKNGEPYFAD